MKVPLPSQSVRDRGRLHKTCRSLRRFESLEDRVLLAFDIANSAAFQRADIDGNGVLESTDIDSLSAHLRSGGNDARFDLNRDGSVDSLDHDYWVVDLRKTYPGDADLDGRFGSNDFIEVFQRGHYEQDELAGWGGGDWDGNGRFNSGDLIVAFKAGAYDLGGRDLAPPTLSVESGYPASDLVQIDGTAAPFVMWQVAGRELAGQANADGEFRIDLNIGNEGTSFDIEFGDINGNVVAVPVDISIEYPSTETLHQYAPWGELTPDLFLSEIPASLTTAFTPAGVTRLQLADNATRKTEAVTESRVNVAPGDQLNVVEDPSLTDTQPIVGFGASDGQSAGVVISGTLEPAATELFPQEDDGSFLNATETGLDSTPNRAAFARAVIGDGAFGSLGTGTGDFDFYALRGLLTDQIITIDINTPVDSDLDSFIYVWNSDGETIDVNDNGNSSSDSYLEFQVRKDGDYFVSVAGYGSFAPVDPFDSSSGFAAGSEGEYEIVLGVDYVPEIDSYQFDLQAGDIIGATSWGGANHLTLRDSAGIELMGSGQDLAFIYPRQSPLPSGGNASLSWVVDAAGTFQLDVDGGAGDYEVQMGAFRPVLESAGRSERQVLFLDFDGATIDSEALFGVGNPSATLSPLVDFLPGWGLTEADEDRVIDAIADRVRENFSVIGIEGSNGDFDADEIDGHFGIQVITSRESEDALGYSVDPFGADNVSRIIIGGSMEQLGIQTIGIAESIDVGNFDLSETGVVLLDLLSAEVDPNSLNQYELADGSTIEELVGVAVGNIVSHEAGHFFASWHTDQFNDLPRLMDQGGNLANTIGIGDDGVFGSDDDISVKFGIDTFVPNEGFTGYQNPLEATAFGLSTGTVDRGMVVIESTPEDGRQLASSPTDFRLRFIDAFDVLPAANAFRVNGVAATSVERGAPTQLVFSFDDSPVIEQGVQSMELAAGAVDRLSDGAASLPFVATFGVDQDRSQVMPLDSTAGIVSLPLDRFTVRTDEPYLPSSIGIDDLLLSQGVVSGYELIDDVTVAYLLSGVVNEGVLAIEMPDGAVADSFGNRVDGFEADLSLDISEVTFSSPEVARLPEGSAAYDSVMHGGIAEGDTDAFRFQMDPGQTLAVTLQASAGFVGELTLLSDGRVLDSVVAAKAGENLLLQTTETSGNLVGRRENLTDFVVQVRGADNSVGDYKVQIVVNANLERSEAEQLSNNQLADAESLDSSMLQLGANSAVRTAVFGDLLGKEVAAEGFENEGLNDQWTVSSSQSSGRVTITESVGAAEGRFSLLMDTESGLNLNEAIWTVDLAAVDRPILSFAHANFGDERHPFSGPFEGSFLADGIAVSTDGVTWLPIYDSPDTAYGEWDYSYIELAGEAERYGLDLSGELKIKFQQFDNFGVPIDGRAWDDVAITHADEFDWFSFQASQGDSVTVATSALDQSDVAIDLYDAAGNVLVNGRHIVKPLSNGSFEDSFADWTVTTTGATNRPWQVSSEGKGGRLFIDTTTPQDGQLVAWNGFDGEGPFQYQMHQDVFIPSDIEQAEFTWQHRIQWAFFIQGAQEKTLAVEVVDPDTNTVLETLHAFTTGPEAENPFGDTGWQTLSHDLSDYAGSTVRLLFTQNVPEVYTGPAQIEFDGMEIDLGQTLPVNIDDVIDNFAIPQNGTYYVRVAGEPLTRYGLVATRNVEFNLEQAGDTDSVQPLLGSESQGRRWVLGRLGLEGDAVDRYEISLGSGKPLTVETLTPADGIGLFTNELDPELRLYDSEGNLVAEDDNSAADGRNAELRYRVPRGGEGTFILEVGPADGSTGGEYILSLQGAAVAAIASDAVAAALAVPQVETEEREKVAVDAPPAPLAHSIVPVDLVMQESVVMNNDRTLVEDDGETFEQLIDELTEILATG